MDGTASTHTTPSTVALAGARLPLVRAASPPTHTCTPRGIAGAAGAQPVHSSNAQSAFGSHTQRNRQHAAPCQLQSQQQRGYSGLPPAPAAAATVQRAPPPPPTLPNAEDDGATYDISPQMGAPTVSSENAPMLGASQSAAELSKQELHRVESERLTPSGTLKPGLADDENFEQHWSVYNWRNFSWPPKDIDLDSAQGVAQLAQRVARNAQAANMARDGTSSAYWAYHIMRTSFFLVQAAAAVIAQVRCLSLWQGDRACAGVA